MEYLDVNKRGFYESLIIFHSYKRIYITQVFRSHIIHPSALKDAHSKDTSFFKVKCHKSIFKYALKATLASFKCKNLFNYKESLLRAL